MKDNFEKSIEMQIAHDNIELFQCPEERQQYWTGRIEAFEDILKRYVFLRDNCQQCQEEDCVVSMEGTCAKMRIRTTASMKDET